MWIVLGVGAVLVIIVAFVAVGMAVGRMENETVPNIYRLPDAVDFVAERLPTEVAARVSYDDVRQILTWHLDWFNEIGLAAGAELGDSAVTIGDTTTADLDAAIDAIVAHSVDMSIAIEPVDIVVILDLQSQYLDQIGAVSPTSHNGPTSQNG